jgi:hypothetical protein
MTVYTGRTFQTCALRVWGVWVSMRDFHAATVRLKPLKKEEPHAISRGAAKCGIRNLDAPVDRWLHLLINTEMMIVAVHCCGACVRRAYNDERGV